MSHASLDVDQWGRHLRDACCADRTMSLLNPRSATWDADDRYHRTASISLEVGRWTARRGADGRAGRALVDGPTGAGSYRPAPRSGSDGGRQRPRRGAAPRGDGRADHGRRRSHSCCRGPVREGGRGAGRTRVVGAAGHRAAGRGRIVAGRSPPSATPRGANAGGRAGLASGPVQPRQRSSFVAAAAGPV